MKRGREALIDGFGGVILVGFVFFLMPRATTAIDLGGRKTIPGGGSKSYAVIFDAGSSGSRVHVYCFDANLNLLNIGDEIELFVQATAGLRILGTETSEKILQSVRDLLQNKSSLKFKPDWVTILDGTQEGTFQWVATNYLLGGLGKEYSETVGVVDLGGGSVQMAYAISEADYENAPRISDGEDSYVKKLLLKGTTYYLYVHSYLHYGLLAARAEILKAGDESFSSCILGGYNGSYKYGGMEFKAAASPSGSSFSKCKSDAIKALNVNETCTHMKCTFGGVWNGGGGDGLKSLFVASFFFDLALEAGFVDPEARIAKLKPVVFKNAAKHACKLSVADAKATYPLLSEYDLPYFCMDLVYQYTLLVDGFALKPRQEITLVRQVKYGNAFVEAAWPLGSAIEVASSTLKLRGDH